MKIGGAFLIGLILQLASVGEAAELAGKTSSYFSLINLIRSPQPATLKIGSEPVGIGQMSLGFCTGTVTWIPAVPLVVEAPGFGAVRIPFTPTVSGESPLFVVQDALEKPPGGAIPGQF